MGFKGKIIRKFNVREEVEGTKKDKAAGYENVGKQMVEDIKELLGNQTGLKGPPSKRGQPPNRRTGTLQGSITANAPQDGSGVSIRSTAPHAAAQEYGYLPNNLPKRPYVAAAILGNRASYGKILRDTVKELTESKATKKKTKKKNTKKAKKAKKKRKGAK